MEHRIVQAGALRVHVMGSGTSGPAVLLAHGFGAPGSDLVGLAEVVDGGPGVRWFFPEAPLDLMPIGVPGRAWWPIDMARLQRAAMTGDIESLLHETPAGLPSARAALEGCLAALQRDHGVSPEQLVIGGFSQGAMLTTEIALHAARPFAGLAILSGTLISADRWRAAASSVGARLHVLQSHGRADPILPFEAAGRLRALLEKGGARLTWVEHRGGHEIPGNVVEQLGVFLRGRLSASQQSPAGGLDPGGK